MSTYGFIIIMAILNVIAFSMYGIDKYKAKNNKWRISEQSLILMALFGPFGATLGVVLFHHKTRKAKFKLVYVFLVLHIAIIVYLVYKGHF